MAGKEKFDLIVRAKDQASASIKGITKNVAGMVSAFVSVRAVGGFLKESIELGIESEKVYNDLSASVERHGMTWEDTEKKFRSFAGALQSETSLSDEEIARSMQTLIDFGSSADQAMTLVRTAADLAVGTNVSLASATDLVAKASIGYTSTLARYGIILDESIPKAEKFHAAIAKMNEMFGGAAAARMNSTAGKLKKLAEQFGDTQEKIGDVFIKEGLDPLLDKLGRTERAFGTLSTRLENLGIEGEAAAERVTNVAKSALFMQMPLVFQLLAKEMQVVDNAWKSLDKTMQKNETIRDFFEMIMGLVEEADKFVPTVAPVIQRSQEEHIAFIGTVRDGLEVVAEIGPTISAGYERFGAAMSESRQPVVDFIDNINEFDDLTGNSIPNSVSRAVSATETLTDAESRAVLEANALFGQTQDIVNRGMTDAAHSILAVWSDTRRDMADIFKGMADDFFRSFVSRVLSALAGKLAGSILSFLFPQQAALSLGGAVVSGALGGANRGKVAAPGATSAGVTVNINGPILGEEQHVRERVIPVIERAAELGKSKIVVRGA